MLEEMHIRNFAIIDQLELDFQPGFNVITGETGAGKSIIIDAVALLLGAKADTAFIRTGAERAVVEGIFRLSGLAAAMIRPILDREDLRDETVEDEVILYRELRSNGRSIARVNGVTVKVEVLREIGETLVDIHGQTEHMSLFNKKQHLELIDRYADLMEIREALHTLYTNLGHVRSEIKALKADEAAIQRRAERLQHEVEEIDAAALRLGEDDDLKTERSRLGNSEQLASLAGTVVALLNGDESASDDQPAVDKLMEVAAHLGKLAAIDPELGEWQELAEGISAQAQELAMEMAGYADSVEYDPVRLDEIEERLELINKLKRRYGGTLESVLDYAERALAELDGIENSEARLEELEAKEHELLLQIGELAGNVSEVRRKTGNQLSRRVMQELEDLRMQRARFELHIGHTEAEDGCFVGDKRLRFDATGIDDVEFMLSANPGEPLRPLAKVASGGEAARIMLALKRVLTQADHTPTLIFDEVDQGIGGRIGSVVGEKLWTLTQGHQVLVVTHMPQLAGYADRHYHVRKRTDAQHTATEVIALESEDARVHELSEMLGASGEGSVQSAREILDVARAFKGAQLAARDADA